MEEWILETLKDNPLIAIAVLLWLRLDGPRLLKRMNGAQQEKMKTLTDIHTVLTAQIDAQTSANAEVKKHHETVATEHGVQTVALTKLLERSGGG